MNLTDNISKVAVVQDSPVFLNRDATIDKAISLIKKASSEGAKLVLFPEAFISGYPDWVWGVKASDRKLLGTMYTDLYNSAVSLKDDSLKLLCAAASENKIFVVIGANEKNSESSNATLYNSMVYISNQGEILGVHRKLIPTGGERLVWGQGDGSTLLSFDTPFGKIGGLICWENFMPLPRNVMYTAGVQIYLAPTWDSSERWHNAMRYIAYEGGMYLLNCAQAMKIDEIPDAYEFKKLIPKDREWLNNGNSCIISPSGEVIAEPLKAKKGILYADIDLNEIPNQKCNFDVAGHYARPDVFNFSVNK